MHRRIALLVTAAALTMALTGNAQAYSPAHPVSPPDNANNQWPVPPPDQPNVIAFYQPANFGKLPVSYEAKTQVHVGDNRWLYANHNARLVDVVKNGIAYKQIKLLKGQRVLRVQVAYAKPGDQSVYTSRPWSIKRDLIPVRTTDCLDNRDSTQTCSRMRLVFARYEIFDPARPIPDYRGSGKGGDAH